MSINLSLNTQSPEETLLLAKTIGANLRGHEVIELISDLGGGKTTFTKGLAEGSGSIDKVHSPSFTIENEYKTDNLMIHHMDFYRLNDPGIMKNELVERLEDPKSVVVIEWAGAIQNLLPENRLVIKIQVVDETSRQLNLSYPESLSYLVEGLK